MGKLALLHKRRIVKNVPLESGVLAGRREKPLTTAQRIQSLCSDRTLSINAPANQAGTALLQTKKAKCHAKSASPTPTALAGKTRNRAQNTRPHPTRLLPVRATQDTGAHRQTSARPAKPTTFAQEETLVE